MIVWSRNKKETITPNAEEAEGGAAGAEISSVQAHVRHFDNMNTDDTDAVAIFRGATEDFVLRFNEMKLENAKLKREIMELKEANKKENMALAKGFKHHIKEFEEDFEGILRDLEGKGARLIIVVMPALHPRSGSPEEIRRYITIREVIQKERNKSSLSYVVLNVDDLFFSLNNEEEGFLTQDSDNLEISNIKTYSTSFEIGARNVVLVSKPACRFLGDRIRETVIKLKQAGVIPWDVQNEAGYKFCDEIKPLGVRLW